MDNFTQTNSSKNKSCRDDDFLNCLNQISTRDGVNNFRRQQARNRARVEAKIRRQRSKERDIMRTAARNSRGSDNFIPPTSAKARRTLGIAPVMSLVHLASQLYRLWGSTFDLHLSEDELSSCCSVSKLRDTFHLEEHLFFLDKLQVVHDNMLAAQRSYLLQLAYLKLSGRPFRFDLESGEDKTFTTVPLFSRSKDSGAPMPKKNIPILLTALESLGSYTAHMTTLCEHFNLEDRREKILAEVMSTFRFGVSNPGAGFLILSVLANATQYLAIKEEVSFDEFHVTVVPQILADMGKLDVNVMFLHNSSIVDSFKRHYEVARIRTLCLFAVLERHVSKSGKFFAKTKRKVQDFHSAHTEPFVQKVLDTLKLSEGYLNQISHVINIAEVLLVLCNILSSRCSSRDVFAQLYLLARLHLPYLKSAIIASLCTALHAALFPHRKRKDEESNSGDVYQTESLEEWFEGAANSVDYVLESKLVSSIVQFIIGLCSFKIFDKEVAFKLHAFFGKNFGSQTIPSLISLGLKIIAQILKVCRLLWEGVPVVAALFEEDPVSATLVATQELLIWQDKLYTGLPVPGKMAQIEFYRKAKAYLMIFDKALERLPQKGNTYMTVFKARLQLQTVISNVDCAMMGAQRITPLWINIAGPPGIGKSTILHFNAFLMSEVLNIEYSDSLIFSRITSSEYWDGYDPVSQPFIHYSELGAQHVNIVKNKGSEAITELTSLVDSLAFSVNMAFDQKGKVFARPWMVISDTNVEQLNLKVIVNEVAAYLRRMWVVRPRVRPEYATPTGEPISDLIKKLDKPLNAWLFTLVKFDNTGKEIVILADADAHEYANTIRTMMKNHILNQTAMVASRDPNNLSGYGQLDSVLDVLPREQQKPVLNDKRSDVLVNEFESEKSSFFGKAYEKTAEMFSSYRDPFFGVNMMSLKESFTKSKSSEGLPMAVTVGDSAPDDSLLEEKWSNPYDLESGVEFDGPIDDEKQRSIDLIHARRDVLAYLDEKIAEKESSFDQWVKSKSTKLWILFEQDENLELTRKYFHKFVVSNKMEISFVLMLFLYLGWISLFPFLILLFSIFLSHSNITFNDKLEENLVSLRMYCQHKLQSSIKAKEKLLLWSDPRFDAVIKVITGLGAVVAVGVSIAALCKAPQKKEKKKSFVKIETQAKTEFPIDDTDHTVKINDVEEKVDSGSRLRRVTNSQLTVWNSIVRREPPVYNGSPDSLDASVRHNVRLVEISFERSENGQNVSFTATSRLTGIKGNFALINDHFVRKHLPCTLKVYHSDDATSSYVCSRIGSEDVIRIGNDASLVRVSSVQFRDITKHFSPGTNLPLHGKGSIGGDAISIAASPNVRINDDLTIANAYMYNWSNHKYGRCGTPIIMAVNNGCLILGIHCAGAVDLSQPVGICEVVHKANLDMATSKLSGGLMEVNSQSEIGLDLVDPISKSSFMHLHLPNVTYYGRVNAPVLAFAKSRLVRSCWSRGNALGELEEVFFSNLEFLRTKVYVPPLMMAKWHNGNWASPYNICLSSLNVIKPALDRTRLLTVVDLLVNHIHKGLIAGGITKLNPLTFEEAMNGVVDDPYIRRINASTAAGFGMPGKKKAYLNEIKQDEIFHPNADVRKQVEDILVRFEKGENSESYYKANLKDEPRNRTKVDKGETRVFYSSQFPHLLINRMFLGPLYSLMVSHSSVFCTAVGIDMHRDYHKLFLKMRGFSPFAMELDYKSYDQCMPFDIGWAAASVVEKLCERLGYNEEAMVYVRGCLSDSLFPLVVMLGDVFSSPGLQPSGKAYTAEDNSLRQLIMLVYAWKSIPALSDRDFFQYVMPLTYGDDLVAPVKIDVIDVFNNQVYANLCLELFGMTCTDSQKGSEMPAYLAVENVNFLKRNCKLRMDLNRYCGVLEIDSIFKSLEWTMPSDYVVEYEQATSTMQSALREIFFHVGEREFHNVKEFLLSKLVSTFKFVDESWFRERAPNYSVLFDEFALTSVENKSSEMGELLCTQSCLLKNLRRIKNEISPSDRVLIRNLSTKPRISMYEFEMMYHIDTLKDELKQAQDVLYSVPPPETSIISYDIREDPSYKPGTDYAVMVDAYLKAKEHVHSLEMTIKLLESNLAKMRRTKFALQSGIQSDGKVEESLMKEAENFVDVAGDTPDLENAGWSLNLPTYSGTSVELGDFLSRPVAIFSFTTAPGVNAVQTIDPWSLYMNQPSVRAKLKNFAYIRATLNLRIAVAGSPFHALQAVVAYVPVPGSNEIASRYATGAWTTRSSRPTWLSQAVGSKIMQVRDNAPLDMVIPFVFPTPAAALWRRDQTTVITAVQGFDSIAALGRLCIHSPRPLVDVAPTPTSVSWYVYAHLTDVQLGCPTKTVIELTTESDERVVGPVEKIASAGVSVADALTPYFGVYAKASSIALGALSKVASIFGWSHPIMNTEPTRMKNEPYQNAAHTIGYSLGQKISIDPKQELTVDPRVGGINVDELSIEHLCSIPSYLTSTTWEVNSTTSTPLLKLPVYPKLAWYSGVPPSEAVPTSTCFAAMPFQYWRGKIHFRIDVIATQFNRGKVAIVYEPNVAQNVLIDSSGLQLNKQFIQVLDIQEAQSIEVCVDWATPRPWLSCSQQVLITEGNVTVATNAQESYNGYIAIYPMVQLQGPDSDALSINVYTRASDMHFNFFDPSLLPVLALQSEEQRNEHTCADINPCGATTVGLHDHNFGEAIHSLRPLLKRFAITRNRISPAPTTGTDCIQITEQLFPPLEPRLGTPVSTPEPLLLNWVRMAFHGMRGSMRYRVTGRYLDMQTLSAIRVFLLPVTSTYADSIVANAPVQHPARGSLMFVPRTNGGIEFELPFYSNLFYLGSGINTGTFDDTAIPDTFVRNFAVQVDTAGNFGATTQAAFTVYAACGEDFTVFRYYGATPFWVAA